MNIELKPCPFCGSTDLVLGGFKGILEDRLFVHCRTCVMSGPLGKQGKNDEDAAKKAIQVWNRRMNDVESKDD